MSTNTATVVSDRRCLLASMLVGVGLGCGGLASSSQVNDDRDVRSPPMDGSLASDGGGDAANCENDERCGMPSVDAEAGSATCGPSKTPCLGSCEAGVCFSILAADQNAAFAIAVDDHSVYWTNRGAPGSNSGSVMSVPTSGGTPQTLVAAQESPYDIVVFEGFAYWSDEASSGSVQRISVSGGSANSVAGNQQRPGSLSVSGDHVYWINVEGGDLLSAPLSGGSPATLASGLTGGGLAVDSTYIYSSATGLIMGQGYVVEMALAGGSVATLAASQTDPRGIVEDSINVYWVDGLGGSVMACPITGCGGAALTLAAGQGYPENLTVDAAYVYWANTSTGSVAKVPIGGGSVTTLSTGQSGVWDVAVDDVSVYWTTMSAVMKRTPK
jgi:hypothetical protein